MAHFAQLDDNNIVTQVIVVANEELLTNGVEEEIKGILFCKSLFGGDTKWFRLHTMALFVKTMRELAILMIKLMITSMPLSHILRGH
jgi:hypothetical protein